MKSDRSLQKQQQILLRMYMTVFVVPWPLPLRACLILPIITHAAESECNLRVCSHVGISACREGKVVLYFSSWRVVRCVADFRTDHFRVLIKDESRTSRFGSTGHVQVTLCSRHGSMTPTLWLSIATAT